MVPVRFLLWCFMVVFLALSLVLFRSRVEIVRFMWGNVL
jgi:hypothetical protein